MEAAQNRRHGQASPGDLAGWIDPAELQAPHLDVIDEAFRRIDAGLIGAGRRKVGVIISMPPRHGKSRRAARWGPLWFLRRNPARRVMLSSYSADLADDHARWIRDTIERHPGELGLALSSSNRSANQWDLANTGSTPGGLVAVGVGGSATGKGGDLLICDDPVKDAAEADSPTYRRRAWEWWQSTWLTRLAPGGAAILIGTRWHEDDLIGRVLETERDRWVVIELPAIAETDTDALGRQVGEPLWPDRFDADALADMRRRVGERVWGALYQQSPRPHGGGVWKWPHIESARILNPRQVPDLDRVIVAVDPAVSAGTGSDETGIVGMGAGVPIIHTPGDMEAHGYVLADKSGRYTPREWSETACMLAYELGAQTIVIEKNQGGDMTGHTLRTAWETLRREGKIPATMLCPAVVQVHSKDGKRLRAEPVAVLYERGLYHHIGNGFGTLEDQMIGWLPGMDSPDRLDALVHGATFLHGAGSARPVRQSPVKDRRLAGRR